MFLRLHRERQDDAPYWSGRKALGALDALAWPVAWVIAVRCFPDHGGVFGWSVVAFCALAGARRLRVALWRNHRYRFTTWRWLRRALTVLLFAYALKWALGA